MRAILILTALVGLASFAWARRSFFVMPHGTPPRRNGLGPAGTALGILLLILLLFSERTQLGLRSAAALALMIGSQLLFWRAMKAFGPRRPSIAFSPGAPEALVASGPYRYVRHPFYLAYTLFWLGGLIAVPHWPLALGVAVICTLYYRAAALEEKVIAESPLGDQYAAYKKTAGMFLPRVGRPRD